jgi:tRNA(Ile)-lysidine synthase
MRLGVGVSGGADSVALVRTLAARWRELGLALTVLHVHHGVRGAEADADAAFVEDLARELGLRLLRHDVDTPGHARSEAKTLEEAARDLRYAWFEELLAQGALDAVATAHTLDDQAETVLQKLLRGAWTEGLAGVFPIVERPGGVILRPFLETRRADIETWLQEIGQTWREDSTNRDAAYTRNRIRHHLLPVLGEYNPKIAAQLSHMAEIARDEDAYWQAELKRALPPLLLPGKPVRGGGRSSSTHPDEASVGMEIDRLRTLHPALQRRALRAAGERLGCHLTFDQTQILLDMCEGKAGRREVLTAEVRAERTPRELRLVRESKSEQVQELPEYEFIIPGQVTAEGFGLKLTASTAGSNLPGVSAKLRAHKPGDRVQLRHSSHPKRIKEVLERMRIAPADRKIWPVLEWQGEIVWMQGMEVTSRIGGAAGLKIETQELP